MLTLKVRDWLRILPKYNHTFDKASVQELSKYVQLSSKTKADISIIRAPWIRNGNCSLVVMAFKMMTSYIWNGSYIKLRINEWTEDRHDHRSHDVVWAYKILLWNISLKKKLLQELRVGSKQKKVKFSTLKIPTSRCKFSFLIATHYLQPRREEFLNPLNPNIKLQILLLCFHAFRTEVVGRSC